VTVTEDEIDKLLATIMSPQEQRELGDLTTTAIERTRRTVMLVGQLIEQDALRAAMISAVAFDMLRGAAGLLADATGRPQPEMFALIIDGIQAKARKNDRAQGLQRHHQGDGGNVRSGRQAYRKQTGRDPAS
jgi:predicted neutral ceramidase superfamily lipid hydrolase